MFSGPLFIVGMPRSGTKLLRDLLNRHDKVSIPEVESHFIPYFLSKYEQVNPDLIDQLWLELENTPYFKLLNETGVTFDKKDFLEKVDKNSWASIFEYLLKNGVPKTARSLKNEKNIIWGDKTPGYLNHVSLLKEVFPQARFVHIIRDPRDYSLSVKKTWGKSLYRAAYRWSQSISQAQKEAAAFQKDYLEVKYEDLVVEPAKVIKQIAAFIDIKFDKKMLTLSKPSETHSQSTKGQAKIVKSNIAKFHKALSKNQIRAIEELNYNLMKKLGYKIYYAKQAKKVSQFKLRLAYIYDGWASFVYSVKVKKSLAKGLSRFINFHNRSSWR